MAALSVAGALWWLVAAPRSDQSTPSRSAGQAAAVLGHAPLVRIAVAGDTGTGDAHERATVAAMTAVEGPYEFDALLLLGDLVYDLGDSDLVDDRVTVPFAPLIEQGTELVPVLGNHDYELGQEDQILTALGRGDRYYVDRVGSVRIIVLDSNRVDAAETLWLRHVLETTPPGISWTVAAMHHPAYSAGEHGSDLGVRNAWSPLFAQYDVSLVLAGHDHDYQRSEPVDGVTYVVSGGGAKLRPTGSAEFTAVSSSVLHFLDLAVYDDRIQVRAVDQSGGLVDQFEIR